MGTAVIAKYSSFEDYNLGKVYRKGTTPPVPPEPEPPTPEPEHYAFIYSACGYYGSDTSRLGLWCPESKKGTTIKKSRVQLYTKISDKYPSMNDKFYTNLSSTYTQDSIDYITKVLDVYSYPSFTGASTITIQLLDKSVISKYGVRIIDPSLDTGINIYSGKNGAWITDSEFTVDLTSLSNYSEDTTYYLGLTMAKDDQKSDIETITLGKDIKILIDGEEFNETFDGQLDYTDI